MLDGIQIQEKIILLKKELQNLTDPNGTLANLNFVAAGNSSKGAKSKREGLINQQLKLIEEIRIAELKNKIINKIPIAIEEVDKMVFWHCRKAPHMQIREVAMYERIMLDRFPIGNIYDIVFQAEKSLQPYLKKYGFTYKEQHVLKDKEGRYTVSGLASLEETRQKTLIDFLNENSNTKNLALK